MCCIIVSGGAPTYTSRVSTATSTTLTYVWSASFDGDALRAAMDHTSHKSPTYESKRRSEIREAEIHRLLAESRVHTTPRSRSFTAASHRSPRTLTEHHDTHAWESELGHAIESPSVGAKIWRDRHESLAKSKRAADFGDEYIQPKSWQKRAPSSVPPKPQHMIPTSSFETTRSSSMNELTTSMSGTHLDSTPRTAVQYGRTPRTVSRSHTSTTLHNEAQYSQHTHNLRMALMQYRKQLARSDASNSELMAHFEVVAHLAETINQGLQSVIRKYLNDRMSNNWMSRSPSSDQRAGHIDAELSALLKYSDDQVRHTTDSLLLLLREQRALQQQNQQQSLRATPFSTQRQMPASSTATSETTADVSGREHARRRTSQPPTGPWHEQLFPHASTRTGTRAFSLGNSPTSPPLYSSHLASLWPGDAASAETVYSLTPSASQRYLSYDID